MCETKKLCTCEQLNDGEDYWKLEFHYGFSPWSSEVVETRPEHQELAQKMCDRDLCILGPVRKALFGDLFSGKLDGAQISKIVKEETHWLNTGDPFDFDYLPFHGDRLTFSVGSQYLIFKFTGGRWEYQTGYIISIAGTPIG